jgi:hypothetical protein
LETKFNPSRTFKSKFATSQSATATINYGVPLIEVVFNCNPADFTISTPTSLVSPIKLQASPSDTSVQVSFDDFVATPIFSPCTDGTLHYSYHGDAVYNSGVTAPGIIASNPTDLSVRSFEVDTTPFGTYSRYLYIQAFFPNVETTTGDKIHGYSGQLEI